METGLIEVAKVGGKSTVIRTFSKYPLKFIVPKKVGPCDSDAVWIYSLSYGGGIVSGDSISCNFTIGDECTAVWTTQASTKVYKSVGSKCSKQNLEVLLEQGSISSIAERMQDYQVIAMVIILGPKFKDLQSRVQENVKNMMSRCLQVMSSASEPRRRTNSDFRLTKPNVIASCSAFGPKGVGVIVRVASTTTESVQLFLHHQLACLEPLLGASPYS